MGNSQTSHAQGACEWDALAQPNVWGDSAIHRRVRLGNTRELKEVYWRARSAGALVSADHARMLKVLNAPDGKGCTPLFISAEAGHADMLTLLLQLGANPCIGDRLGRLPIHMACLRGSTNMVQTLLRHPVRHWAGQRAQLELPTASGFTALHYAVGGGDVATIGAVLEYKPQLTIPSTHATWEAGLDFPAGTTPLHVAAATATPQVVRMLLAYYAMQVRAAQSRAVGPDPRTMRNKRGHSPHQVALRLRKHEVASLLDPSVHITEHLPVLCGTTLQALASKALQQHLLKTLASMRTAVSTAVVNMCTGPISAPYLTQPSGNDEAASSTLNNATTTTFTTMAIITMQPSRSSTSSGSRSNDSRHGSNNQTDDISISNKNNQSGENNCSSSHRQLISTCCARRSHSSVLPALLWEVAAHNSIAQACVTDSMSAQATARPPHCCCEAPSNPLMQLDTYVNTEPECSICFGSRESVQLVPCRHQVCAECAAQVVSRMGCRPATCPFCRSAIYSFKQPHQV